MHLWSDAASAVHHALEPPVHRVSLEDLANTRIPGSAGDILSFVAKPQKSSTEDAGKKLPVLVMIHEFFGLNPSIVEKAQLFADELDCLVIAPDTFRGEATTFIPKAIFLALTAPQERVNNDLNDVLRWAEGVGDPSCCAVLGFCYGGGKALGYTTSSRPDAATVLWYGNPITDPAVLSKLQAPVCGIFGSLDLQIPPPLVSGFATALSSADVDHTVKTFDGVGHAFFSSVAQVEKQEAPVYEAFELSTQFLKDFFDGKRR